jgi:hypothetical protein
MKMEQILAQLLDEMNAIQEKMDSDQEEIRINQERMDTKLGAEIKTIQDKKDSHNEKLMAIMKTNKEQITAKMDDWIEGMEECVGKLAVNPQKSDAIVEHQEVPTEEASVKLIIALKKRHGDRHLAVGCRRKLKKRTKDNGGSWKKLAAACSGTTGHAGMAQCIGHSRQGQGQDIVLRGTSKRWMFGKRSRPKPESNNSIRGQGLRQQLHLGSKRAFNKIIRWIFGLEIMKQAVRISSRLWKVRD